MTIYIGITLLIFNVMCGCKKSYVKKQPIGKSSYTSKKRDGYTMNAKTVPNKGNKIKKSTIFSNVQL